MITRFCSGKPPVWRGGNEVEQHGIILCRVRRRVVTADANPKEARTEHVSARKAEDAGRLCSGPW